MVIKKSSRNNMLRPLGFLVVAKSHPKALRIYFIGASIFVLGAMIMGVASHYGINNSLLLILVIIGWFLSAFGIILNVMLVSKAGIAQDGKDNSENLSQIAETQSSCDAQNGDKNYSKE
jgi:ABC-type multidrug transport system permease subunit